ncbi:MAG TPA: hypothetical protein VGP53_05055, partial [Acidimicrobiales bacterium]|nr:hypothetical protein [Acidimicrobiales bacterium]
MLLLVTILLVVVGAISLVIGYVQSATLPIFVSIGCSIVAGALLLIFTRMTAKTQESASSSGGPAPLGFAPSERTEAVPAMAGSGFLGRRSSEEAFAGDSDAGGAGGAALARYDDDDEPAVDDDFPIERYDARRVGEILPLLAELDVDELDVVREHEERGKGRATVLARIDQLIEQLEAEDRDEAEHRFDAPVNDDHDDEVRPAPPAASPVRVAALPIDDDYFPIEDYDDLRASEILPLLPELDDDELDMVRERERTGSGRSSILHRIDALLEVEPAAAGPGPVPHQDDEPEPEPEPVVVASGPVRKARATKVPATKAPPVKAPPVKAPAARTAKAAPVKAAVAKVPSKAPRATKAAPPVARA